MPAAVTDRNLLFGILALQMDFITRDALIKAMNAWVLEKATPLGELLVEQGALAADLRDFVDVMIAKHLEQHHNDPQQSLAALSAGAALRCLLAETVDPDVRVSLGFLARDNPPPVD